MEAPALAMIEIVGGRFGCSHPVKTHIIHDAANSVGMPFRLSAACVAAGSKRTSDAEQHFVI
jgi:hypothetical protein